VSQDESRGWRATAGLVSAPLFWLVVFFVVPVCFIAAYSFGGIHVLPTEPKGISFDTWHRFLSGKTVYMGLFWKSIRISLTVSIVVVLLSYPVGYFLALCVKKRKYVLLLVIIAPFLTSYLLRVLAWKVILGDAGVVNTLLYQLHLRTPDHPISWLIYSQFAVMLVLAYVWIPFVALPIFVGLDNLDRSLLEAAGDLGANRFRTFLRVTLPLSLPGVTAAFVFVFVPTIGEFVTPLLVGGPGNRLFGNAIQDQFARGEDWVTGSVLAFFLLVVVGVLMALFGRFVNVRNVQA
jgi:spermidine/putrescine transport system permease protein